MPTQAYEEESNFPGLSVSYWLRVLYGQQASYLPLFFIHYIHFFPPLSFEAQRVSPHSYIKRQKSRLQPSGLPNWTASHFSFMPLYADQGSGTKLFFFFLSFFVARQHQGYLFCLVECKVNRRNCKALAQLRCHWAAPTTDRGGEEGAAASWGKRKERGKKQRRKGGWSKGRWRTNRGVKLQREREEARAGRTWGERQRRDGLMDGDNEADRSPGPVYGQLE